MKNKYDITDILSVTIEYVLFCDGCRKHTTPRLLRSIISGATMSMNIYRFMLHDLISADNVVITERLQHASDIAYQATRILYELTGEMS